MKTGGSSKVKLLTEASRVLSYPPQIIGGHSGSFAMKTFLWTIAGENKNRGHSVFLAQGMNNMSGFLVTESEGKKVMGAKEMRLESPLGPKGVLEPKSHQIIRRNIEKNVQ